MSATPPHDRSEGPTERATEIQSPQHIDTSIDLSIPHHVKPHPQAPRVAGYVLTELLGEGAYGQVWRAWQVRTRKEVAVKVFKHQSGLDWIFLQREVERLLRLDRHPHIVTLLDAGLDSDPPFYVIDLLDGGSLQRFVGPESCAPPERVAQWMAQVCDALGYVHRKGLIHCDLKPANVLLDEQDRVRVVDFGQSRVFTESAASLGTLFYMAPEQATVTELGKPVQPDVRWDVYAFGATSYAILTGQVPHADPTSTQNLDAAADLDDRLSRYRDVLGRQPVSDRDDRLRDRAGRELAAVIARCMAYSPEKRYESMAEVKADLDALRSRRPVSPLAHRSSYRFAKFVQRNPFGIGLLAALVVILSGVLVFRVQTQRMNQSRAEVIASRFVEDPVVAYDLLDEAGPAVRAYVARHVRQHVESPAYTQRIMGARIAPWVWPEAFWSSVAGGQLGRYGEWLELAGMELPDRDILMEQLADRIKQGEPGERYVAWCLWGQLQSGRKDGSTGSAPVGWSPGPINDPAVAHAAQWALQQAGHPVQPMTCPAIFDDALSGLAFVQVPGCQAFRLGGDARDADSGMGDSARPIAAFWLASTEVTVAAFVPFIEDPATIQWIQSLTERSAESHQLLQLASQAWQAQLELGRGDAAVGWISYELATRYCQWLNARGATAQPRRRYRLPTEYEWEYACRSGNPGDFCYGDRVEYLPYFAHCRGDQSQHPRVGGLMPNRYGLFDMHGSLWEWTDSRFPPALVKDTRLTDAQKQQLYVIRGGAYYSPAVRCRSAQRNYGDASTPGMYTGFRPVMEIVH